MVVLCKRCGKLFRSLVKTAKYCSKCRGHVRYRPLAKQVYRVCEHCGAPYKTSQPRSRFCSDFCRTHYHYVPEEKEKTCKGCGKKFTTSNKREYCTSTCAYKSKLAREEERRNGAKTRPVES